MKSIRRNAHSLYAAQKSAPKDNAYVRTESGTHIPHARKSLQRKYASVGYDGDCPFMLKAFEVWQQRHCWSKFVGKRNKPVRQGGAHCGGALWAFTHKDTQADHCIFMPNMIPHRVVRVRYNFKTMAAARAMATTAFGMPGDEQVVAHKCAQGHLSCVNPNHLYWATPQQNADDKRIHDATTPDEPISDDTREAIKATDKMPEVIAWEYRVPVSQVRAIKA